jgi:alkylhydroperoxidase/carboxymuconolactone decarboxylase family protein YurZ
LRFHLGKAVENGVKKEELIEAITHLAFYSGRPNAMSAIMLAKELSGTLASDGTTVSVLRGRSDRC